jgi:hypothetical protein
MRPKHLFLLCTLSLLLLPAIAHAQEYNQYSYAQIYGYNTTIDLIPATSATGSLAGIKCNFDGDTAIKVISTLDGTATSFVLDPTFFERESSGAGQYLSGWLPLSGWFNSSVHVQISNVGYGSSTINCWISWEHE